MNAVVAILAGGLATRLRPLTDNIPKALVPIQGRPFIEYQLELLASNGVSTVVICTGHKGEQIEAHIRDGSRFGVKVSYSHDGSVLLGTGGALKKALPLLGERFIVIYGDSYLRADYPSLLQDFDESRAGAAVRPVGLMTVFKNAGEYDKSNVIFRDGRIVTYDKKNVSADMDYIDWGLGILHVDAFAPFADLEIFDLADLYRFWVEKGRLLGREVRH